MGKFGDKKFGWKHAAERNLSARLITKTSKITFLGYSNFDSILKVDRSLFCSIGREIVRCTW